MIAENVEHLLVLKAFAHAARFALPNGQILVDSYHCSRYNTQAKRLTAQMFENVFAEIKQLLSSQV